MIPSEYDMPIAAMPIGPERLRAEASLMRAFADIPRAQVEAQDLHRWADMLIDSADVWEKTHREISEQADEGAPIIDAILRMAGYDPAEVEARTWETVAKAAIDRVFALEAENKVLHQTASGVRDHLVMIEENTNWSRPAWSELHPRVLNMIAELDAALPASPQESP